MFKKYFILLFIFTSFVFLNNKASAISNLIKEVGVNTCTSKLINATATNIVSEADLSMNIDVCVVTGSNPPFTIEEKKLPNGFSTTTTINSNVGTTTVIMPYVFEKASIFGNESIKYTISDNANPVNTDTATIDAYVDVMSITLSNDKGILDGGTLGAGNTIVFTCTNSTELYYDPVVGQTNTPVVSDYTGATGYSLVHSITPAVGTHTIECDNIGGSLTRQTFTFTVVNENKLNINNTSYSPTTALSTVNFTWSSNGTNCSFYNYDKSVKFGNATGNAGSGFSFDLVSPNTPSAANSYGYYIKCYDSTDPGIAIDDTNANLASTTETVNGTSTTMAWLPLTASFSCPSGYVADSANGDACVTVSDPPVCTFTDSSSQYVSCTCPGGNISGLLINNTDGSSQTIVPPTSSFAWNNLQYRYEINCPAKTLYPALQRPYTHFLSFNVSAGYIKPGGAIDMNWVIQDPTSTCKIVGVDLKTGQEIFNTDSGNYNPVKTSITVSKSSNSTRNFSDGSFKNLMGSSFVVNNSTRFTASCQNNSAYMPGYYKLVRDVYTTTSQEK